MIDINDILLSCIFNSSDKPKNISNVMMTGDKNQRFAISYKFIVLANVVASNDLLKPDIMNTIPTIMLNKLVLFIFIGEIFTKRD